MRKKVIILKVLVVRPNLAEQIAKQKDLLPEGVEIIIPEKGNLLKGGPPINHVDKEQQY